MTFGQFKKEVLKDPRSKKLNFKPDGRNHYVYRVSHILEEQYYYGSRTEDADDTIGCGYYTSSNYLKKEFEESPENYKVKIIKRFNNPGDKILFESYLHDYFNVRDNDNFVNRANQTPFGFDTTGKFCGGASPKSRAIYKLDKNTGEILEEFNSIKEAEKKNSGGISECCAGKRLTVNDYTWCYKEDYSKELIKEIANRNYDRTGINAYQAKEVIRCCKDTGIILGKWTCASEAEKNTGVSAGQIRECCRDEILTTGGSVWCLGEDYNQELIKKILDGGFSRSGVNHPGAKTVYKVDKDNGKILMIFDTLKDAKMNTPNADIGAAVTGRQKTAGGYIWKY